MQNHFHQPGLCSEVEQRKKDQDPQYTAEIKQALANFERDGTAEMDKENEQMKPTASSAREPKKDKKRKPDKNTKRKRGSAAKKHVSESRSSQNESDESDVSDVPSSRTMTHVASRMSSRNASTTSRVAFPRRSPLYPLISNKCLLLGFLVGSEQGPTKPDTHTHTHIHTHTHPLLFPGQRR